MNPPKAFIRELWVKDRGLARTRDIDAESVAEIALRAFCAGPHDATQLHRTWIQKPERGDSFPDT
jgi:hypothetical protein